MSRGYRVTVADGSLKAAGERTIWGSAFVAWTAGVAWLVFTARSGGWLDSPMLAHEVDRPFGADLATCRVAVAILLPLAAALLGVALARAWKIADAAWLLPLLVAAHPIASALTHDASATSVWIWCAAAAAMVPLLARWRALATYALMGGTLVTALFHLDGFADWGPVGSAVCAPIGDPAAGVAWRRRLAFAAPIMILLFLGHRRRRAGDEWPLISAFMILTCGIVTAGGDLELTVSSGSEPIIVPSPLSTSLRALGLAAVLAIAGGRAWAHRSDRVVVLACVLLMGFSGFNTARQADQQLDTVRDQVTTLIRRLNELPRLDGVEYVDGVIGYSVLDSEELSHWMPSGRRTRMLRHLVDPGLGAQLRVSRFGMSRDGWALEPVMRATRVDPLRLALHSPDHDHHQAARKPADEPTFGWSMPEAEDPGAAGFMFVSAGLPIDAASPTIRRVGLEPGQLAREVRNGRVHYAWRPSIRGGSHKELLREREDLTRRGTTLTWTIVARPKGRLHGFLMAAPRALHARD